MRLGFVQPLRFAALTGAQYSLVWVVRICSNLDTGSKHGGWRAAVARPFDERTATGAWLTVRQAHGRRPPELTVRQAHRRQLLASHNVTCTLAHLVAENKRQVQEAKLFLR
jgi:hypothetical protein